MQEPSLFLSTEYLNMCSYSWGGMIFSPDNAGLSFGCLSARVGRGAVG